MKTATTCIMMEKVPVPAIEEKQTLKTLYNEFGEMSTVHGVKRAIVGRHCVERFIWTLLVTTGGGLAFYQFISIVQEFQTNPVSTVVSVEYEQHMEFPAVTICNLNRVKMSKASDAIKEIFNRTREVRNFFGW